ncbi:hypothetical protein EBZ80_26815, partial [bacterium]|nr:hypothetical protein [bacterium]
MKPVISQDGESSRQGAADPAAVQSDESDSLAKTGSSPTATPLPFDIYWYMRSYQPWNPPERVAAPGKTLVMTTNDARNPNVSVKMRERFPCDNGEWDYSIYYTGAAGVDNPACPRRVVKLHSPERDLDLKPGCGRFKYPLTDCELQPDEEL